VAGLILITSLITELVLFLLRRSRVKGLMMRQALKGLFRPRNATRAILITLAASLAAVFSIFLIEQNLNAAFVRSYPEEAPNVFFIDIQPNQAEEFLQLVDLEMELFPVVRANIQAINGQEIDRSQEEQRRGDNLARTFNLSYRDQLLEGEAILEGNGLFDEAVSGVQVSIFDDVLELADFKLGDTITFNIQGVPLEATISSIRTRTDEVFQPFFEFVFQEETLRNAPQTIFTGARLERSEIPALQNRIVASFPNITVIDATEVISAFAQVVRNLTRIIRFFALFSIVAGVLIIISSIFATRFARVQEAVYFKILGAKRRFVLAVFTLENLLLGLVSASLALLLSQLASWIIITWAFELSYQPFIGASLVMIILTILLVTSVGLLASVSILQKRPIIFLREQIEE
jgi:putative ABC transport system permease protein